MGLHSPVVRGACLVGALLAFSATPQAADTVAGLLESSAPAYTLRVEINGVHIPTIRGGGVQLQHLFDEGDPRRAEVAEGGAWVFSLHAGENRIRVEFHKTRPEMEIPLHLRLLPDAPGGMPVVDMLIQNSAAGTVERGFWLSRRLPAGQRPVEIHDTDVQPAPTR
ncbi:MAG: hypothetical protein LJE84_01255 [Gammaproteobacteria bacterium]|nr:hypothetical protein [Gammaproteobacteria bacterium]